MSDITWFRLGPSLLWNFVKKNEMNDLGMIGISESEFEDMTSAQEWILGFYPLSISHKFRPIPQPKGVLPVLG